MKKNLVVYRQLIVKNTNVQAFRWGLGEDRFAFIYERGESACYEQKYCRYDFGTFSCSEALLELEEANIKTITVSIILPRTDGELDSLTSN